MESQIEADVDLPNLTMNIQIHEFEAVLYCNPQAFLRFGQDCPEKVSKIVKEFGSPEGINSTYETMPSRRLDDIMGGYTNAKVYKSRMIEEQLSIEDICSQCVHFKHWINRLCSISQRSDRTAAPLFFVNCLESASPNSLIKLLRKSEWL